MNVCAENCRVIKQEIDLKNMTKTNNKFFPKILLLALLTSYKTTG